jgi:hypothetical protein
MDWDTALRRELKRFNAAAKRALAKREKGELMKTSSASSPTTWEEALKRMHRKLRRQAARATKDSPQLNQVEAGDAK